MSVTEILKQNADSFGIELNDSALQKLGIYAEQLREWNEKINLTAILDDEGIAVKHFLDCLTIFKYAEIKENAKIIDVGTGAGFPGLVIAAVREDTALTLLDSTGKKLKAVADMAKKMGLTNVTVLHARAEDAGKDNLYREQFDYATARAVANLRTLSEYCLPFVKQGGSFISMKGAIAEEELKEAGNAISILGGKLYKTNAFDLCALGERNIIEIKKISTTPPKYPRPSTQIAGKPL